MTNNEKKSQLRKYYLNLIPYQFRSEKNLELMGIYIDRLINASGIFDNLLDILDIDKMEGKSLDFIGENIIGVDRSSVPFLDPASGVLLTKLNDIDYRFILKFALIVKNVYPSLSNIQQILDRFFLNQIWVTSTKNFTISYIFDESIPLYIIQNLQIKNLIPAPAGVTIELQKKPLNKKFFALPVFYQDGLPVYKPFEQGFGGVLYHDSYKI